MPIQESGLVKFSATSLRPLLSIHPSPQTQLAQLVLTPALDEHLTVVFGIHYVFNHGPVQRQSLQDGTAYRLTHAHTPTESSLLFKLTVFVGFLSKMSPHTTEDDAVKEDVKYLENLSRGPDARELQPLGQALWESRKILMYSLCCCLGSMLWGFDIGEPSTFLNQNSIC
jgi:hypothetical protein